MKKTLILALAAILLLPVTADAGLFKKKSKKKAKTEASAKSEEKKKEENELFQAENTKYLEALNQLTNKEIEAFEDEGEIPQYISDIVTLNTDMRFYFKKIPSMTPSTGGFVYDDISYDYIDRNPDE